MNSKITSTVAKQAYTGHSFYVEKNGKKFDRSVLRSAVRAEGGPGDGRISAKDATRIAKKLNDGGKLTEAEKNTVRTIRDGFNLTPKGRATLAHLDLSAAATRREAGNKNNIG